MTIDDVIVRGYAVCHVLSCVMAFGVLIKGMYSSKVIQREFISRKSFLAQACCILASFTLGWGPPFLIYFTSHPRLGFSQILPLVFFTLPLGVGALYMAGPQEFCLDMVNRTYRLVYGWPFLPKTKIGTTEDIWGVYVKPIRRSGYFVGLRWWGHGRRGIVVEQCGSKVQANKYAQELSNLLGLPLVEPSIPLIP